MKAVVTRAGLYKETDVAFEYEIREDDDALLAANFVHFKLMDGETEADALGLLNSFLEVRVAKWALSDTEGKRSLRQEIRTGERLPAPTPAHPLIKDVSTIHAVELSAEAALQRQRVEIVERREPNEKERADLEEAAQRDDAASLREIIDGLMVRDALGRPVVVQVEEAFEV